MTRPRHGNDEHSFNSKESKMTKENSHPRDNDEEEDLNKTKDFSDPLPAYDLPMDPIPVHDVPIDRGWAWVILFSTSTIGIFVIGGIKSFGVLLMEFARVYQVSKSQLTIIQSITGFFFMSLSPFSNWLCERYTHQRVIFIGGLLASLGLILSSLAPSIEVMYFTYGILTGFGFGLSFPPSVVICTRQFKKRRGMANGINMAGSALGGIFVPILMQVLIDQFGLKGCMLILGSVMAHICPCALLLRPAHKYPLVIKGAVELSSNGQPMKGTQNNHKYSDKKDSSILIESCKKKKEIECGNVENEVRVQLIKQHSPLMSRRHHKVSESSSLGASIAGISSISLSYQSIPKEISQMDARSFTGSDLEHKESNMCYEFFQIFNFSLFKRPSFCLFMVAFFFLAYSYHSIFIILPSYGLERGLTTYQSMFLIPAFGGVDVIGRLTAGFINDKCVVWRKQIFIVYAILHGIGYLFIPAFSDFTGILAWCTAFGIFTGGFNGTFVIMIVDCVGIDMLPSAWGFTCLFVSVSFLVNPVFSGGLTDLSGSWTTAIRVGGSFALFSASLLIIETIIMRGRRINDKNTQEKEVEYDNA